ncbi:hypothetical protein EUX98_g6459 [Antrodiella citrinella]|uniref:HORMA domain-containing protein n=1 Tax=Antrodiella citrinella TaxID=2447956 RepID=A0A4S4MP92_9APHY|nr:hypothetical protein EUX98_g6459 [Antrodiella citrinella]
MQAQSVREKTSQDVLTSQQSLQCIQTLLRAGLGCITYLRNLLPADNFSESTTYVLYMSFTYYMLYTPGYLTSANTDTPSSQPSQSFDSFNSDRRNVSGFKIMTVTRGYTEEADKLLDYLENGIFDALQHQYLRSFIFAIYLDTDDPNNIVEAYTFNFRYYTIPGTTTIVPVMSLGEDLMKMSISGPAKRTDPIVDATKKGRVPTLGEVKKSLKSLIKNLIQATTQMDPLPRRRFATFKLFYHDHTPDDYEPPHFRAGDIDEDKWFFTTHDRGEVPEKCSVGTVQTGWHGVDVRVTSVSGYLPSLENDHAPFLGTTTGRGPAIPALTPVEEAATRAQEAETQRLDAAGRRVVWDAEDGLDADTDGENDSMEDETQVIGSCRMGPLGLELTAPIGVRDENGKIIPVPPQLGELKECDAGLAGSEPQCLYIGAQEDVPSRVGQLCQPMLRPENLEQTQHLDFPDVPRPLSPPDSPLSQIPPMPGTMHIQTRSEVSSQSELPPSDIEQYSMPSVSSVDTIQPTVDTQVIEEIMFPTDIEREDEEMLDLETQVPSYHPDPKPIDSFSSDETDAVEGQKVQSTEEDIPMKGDDEQELLIECECGVMLEDNDLVSCDGACNKWFHVWCMGYHNSDQLQGDTTFICFDCRVRADQHWDLIMLHDLYPRIMDRFRDLALFRRGIKIYETHNPPGLSAFSKLLGCEGIVAGQLFKRLESEGFIIQEVQEQDDFMETTTRKNKSKKGRTKSRQSHRQQGKKSKYVFVEAMKTSQAYVDYFSPDPRVEKRILGLSDLKPKRNTRSSTRQNEEFRNDITTALLRAGQPEDESQQSPSAVATPPALEVEAESQSQTQPEEETEVLPTHVLPEPAVTSELTPRAAEHDKRKKSNSSDDERTTKRMKISVGLPVDLGD